MGIKSGKCKLWIILLWLCSFSCAHAGEIGKNNGFQVFWTNFRQAVISGDKDKLVTMTKFPLVIKGTLDDEPIRFYNKKVFINHIDDLLAQDTGLKPVPESMKSLILNQESVDANITKSNPHEVRIGDFVFRRIGQKWLLVMAYKEE